MTETPAETSPSPKPRRRPLSTRRKLLFVIAPLLLALTATEGGFRIYEWRKARENAFPPDPYTGYRLEPGLTVTHGYQGRLEIHANSLGHRSAEWDPAKPPGAYRVACLGGSSTYGYGAPTNAEAYPQVLEALLNARDDPRTFQVFNAGIPGWNVRTSVTNFQVYLEPYDVDAVVILHANNDLYDGTGQLYRLQSQGTDPESVRPGLISQLAQSSAAIREIGRRLARHNLRHNKAADVEPEGIAAYERNLRFAIHYLREHGVTPILTTYPHIFPPTQAEADEIFGPKRLESVLKRCPLEYPTLIAGLAQLNEVARKVAADEGVALADLARSVPQDPALYVDFIHHNAAGQVLKAESVLAALEAGPLKD